MWPTNFFFQKFVVILPVILRNKYFFIVALISFLVIFFVQFLEFRMHLILLGMSQASSDTLSLNLKEFVFYLR